MTIRYTGISGFEYQGDKAKAMTHRSTARLLSQRALDKILARGGDGIQTERQIQHDGSVVKVFVSRNAGAHVVRAIIISPRGKVRPLLDLTIPDFDCGAVPSPVIEAGTGQLEGMNVVDTVQTQQGQVRVPRAQSLTRQAIPLRSEFATPADNEAMADGVQFSQHRRMKPGNYTGYMRTVVQLLLGVGIAQKESYEKRLVQDGKIPKLSLPVTTVRQLEDMWGLYKKEYVEAAWLAYDYRWERTHGLAWGVEGQCFVIQVGRKGVYAWPFPVDPDSRISEVRDRYELLYPEMFEPDLSGKGLFDLLGGFPTWERPPTTPEIEDLKKAGDIVELLSEEAMSSFYGKQPMYSNCGWAFAPRQNSAVNTCCAWEGNCKKGYLYRLDFFVGLWQEPEWTEETLAIKAKMNSVAQWLKRKIRRLDTYQALSLLSTLETNPDQAEDQLRSMEVNAPVGSSWAWLTEMRNGWLYHPSFPAAKGDLCFVPTGHPQIKFPEEIVGYQTSFSFEPGDRQGWTPKRADGPVWACFVGDQLMVVNYFWEKEDPPKLEPIDTRQPCQYTGQWETRTEAVTVNAGHFTSQFFDLRRTISTGHRSTVTRGASAGSQDYCEFSAFFGTCCNIRQYKFFTKDTTSKSHGGATWWSGLAVPFGDRSIIYAATMAEERGVSTIRTVSAPYSGGSTGVTLYGYVYDWVFHWSSASCPADKGPRVGPCLLSPMGPPDVVPTCFAGAPEFPEYRACDDPLCHAYSGNVCPNYLIKYSFAFNDSVPKTTGYELIEQPVNRFVWEIKLFGDTHLHGCTLLKGAEAAENMERYDTPMSEWWWLSSPVCNPPRYCRFDVSVNRWGRPLINYHDQVDPMEVLHDGAPEDMHIGPGATFFGYVSDEVRTHG